MGADITADQLYKALRSREFTVINQHGLELQGGCYQADTLVTSARGKLMFPDALAESLLEDITGTAQPLTSGRLLPELAAMAAIAAQLDGLDDEQRTRALHWTCERYGVEFQP